MLSMPLPPLAFANMEHRYGVVFFLRKKKKKEKKEAVPMVSSSPVLP